MNAATAALALRRADLQRAPGLIDSYATACERTARLLDLAGKLRREQYCSLRQQGVRDTDLWQAARSREVGAERLRERAADARSILRNLLRRAEAGRKGAAAKHRHHQKGGSR